MSLKQKLDQEKPWAKLRKSRRAYEKDRPWKRAGLPRAKFEELVAIIPTDLIDQLKLEADAKALLAGVFGHENLEGS